jgi:hypothetical protein
LLGDGDPADRLAAEQKHPDREGEKNPSGSPLPIGRSMIRV